VKVQCLVQYVDNKLIFRSLILIVEEIVLRADFECAASASSAIPAMRGPRCGRKRVCGVDPTTGELDTIGTVQSIATSRFRLLFASGKKVLFLSRFDNHGENPPTGWPDLQGGHIVGVAVDASDKLWVAD
jgi:hypothetical protein